jgi:hypothetical protein
MKESHQQHRATLESANAKSEETQLDKIEGGVGEQPVGSFVALRRMSRVQIEAVRMQGCADGAGSF